MARRRYRAILGASRIWFVCPVRYHGWFPRQVHWRWVPFPGYAFGRPRPVGNRFPRKLKKRLFKALFEVGVSGKFTVEEAIVAEWEEKRVQQVVFELSK